jgi:hypothetical protein
MPVSHGYPDARLTEYMHSVAHWPEYSALPLIKNIYLEFTTAIAENRLGP